MRVQDKSSIATLEKLLFEDRAYKQDIGEKRHENFSLYLPQGIYKRWKKVL